MIVNSKLFNCMTHFYKSVTSEMNMQVFYQTKTVVSILRNSSS